MKLFLEGHDYKYAAEQMLATLFPGERPEYTDRPETAQMLVRLSRGRTNTTAVCRYRPGAGEFRGSAWVRTAKLIDETETDRLCQYIIKNAVYRAVRASGLSRPPWGALTGVRPGKLMHAILREGASGHTAVERLISEYDVTPRRAELCYETSLATLQAENSLRKEDICLYVGIPFCPTRCAYCSFVSQATEKTGKLIEPFLDALSLEISAIAEQVRMLGLRVISIYMGGGTPTTLSAGQLEALCTLLRKEFDLSALREFTVEAGRPDTITVEKLRTLQGQGVDRVSVNPQTMEGSVLEAIGRKHTAQEVLDALEKVRRFDAFSVNMDLIAGLPADSTAGFSRTLKTVLSLGAENLTVHTLSLKRGSSLMAERGQIPAPGEVAAMLEEAYAALSGAGYRPYYLYRQKNMSGGFENTGWTTKGHENLYNICMMEELCTILAAGGGGSTKLIRPGGGKNIRLTAPKYPLEYIQQIEKTCKDKRRIGEFYGV